MPVQARKTPAKKTAAKTTPADAAIAEALGDGDVKMTFRGVDFIIRSAQRNDFRIGFSLTAGLYYQALADMLPDRNDQIRFIACVNRGEEPMDVVNEFFAAYADASGEGNSSTS